MSRLSLAILAFALVAIPIAVYFEVSLVAGVSGLLFLVALGYSYVVAKREVELLRYAKEYRPPEQPQKQAKPARVPESMA